MPEFDVLFVEFPTKEDFLSIAQMGKIYQPPFGVLDDDAHDADFMQERVQARQSSEQALGDFAAQVAAGVAELLAEVVVATGDLSLKLMDVAKESAQGGNQGASLFQREMLLEAIHRKERRSGFGFGSRKRFLSGMPCERGAFDAHGEFQYAFERFQLAEFLSAERLGAAHHAEEPFDKLLCFCRGFAGKFLGHDRGRGLADRTAVSVKLDLGDFAVADAGGDLNLVAAQWVVVPRLQVGRRYFSLVSRASVVVKDDFLVKFFEHGELNVA